MPPISAVTEPCQAVERYFEELPHGSNVFHRIQCSGKGLYGIIICSWSQDGKILSFLTPSKQSPFQNFADFNIQIPKLYKTLEGILRALERIRDREGKWEDSAPERTGLYWWMHPIVTKFIPEFGDLRSRFPTRP